LSRARCAGSGALVENPVCSADQLDARQDVPDLRRAELVAIDEHQGRHRCTVLRGRPCRYSITTRSPAPCPNVSGIYPHRLRRALARIVIAASIAAGSIR